MKKTPAEHWADTWQALCTLAYVLGWIVLIVLGLQFLIGFCRG